MNPASVQSSRSILDRIGGTHMVTLSPDPIAKAIIDDAQNEAASSWNDTGGGDCREHLPDRARCSQSQSG